MFFMENMLKTCQKHEKHVKNMEKTCKKLVACSVFPCFPHVFPMFFHVFPMFFHVFPCFSHVFYMCLASVNKIKILFIRRDLHSRKKMFGPVILVQLKL